MAAIDTFASGIYALAMPASNAYVPTNHDTNQLTFVTRGLYVGGAGDVKCVLMGDSAAVTLTAVPAGMLLPIRAKQIFSTGTTATALVAFY